MLQFMAQQANTVDFRIRPTNVLTEKQTHSCIMFVYHTLTGHYNLWGGGGDRTPLPLRAVDGKRLSDMV